MSNTEAFERLRAQFVELCLIAGPPREPRAQMRALALEEFDNVWESGVFGTLACDVEKKQLAARTRCVEIVLPATKKIHVLGVYRIGLDVASKGFFAFNEDRQINGYNGPHINNVGAFCFHEGRDRLMQLYAQGRLGSVFLFVESLLWKTGAGAPYGGAQLENWPLKSDEQKKET